MDSCAHNAGMKLMIMRFKFAVLSVAILPPSKLSTSPRLSMLGLVKHVHDVVIPKLFEVSLSSLESMQELDKRDQWSA